MKISIIVPCYNAEKYLAECLNSLLNQTMLESDYEIILLNDNSTDKTYEILLEYERYNPERILIINCDENHGAGYLRNYGIQIARGDYLLFVDADDLISQEYCQVMYDAVASSDWDYAECSFIMFNDEVRAVCNKKSGEYVFKDGENRADFLIDFGFTSAPWAKIFKKEFVLKNNIKFAEGYICEDILFSHLALAEAKSVNALSDKIYFYRENMEGVSYNAKAAHKSLDAFYVENMLIQELKKRGKLDENIEVWEYFYFNKGFENPYNMLLVNRITYEYIKELHYIAVAIVSEFPNILSNKYVLRNVKSEIIEKFKLCLKEI